MRPGQEKFLAAPSLSDARRRGGLSRSRRGRRARVAANGQLLDPITGALVTSTNALLYSSSCREGNGTPEGGS